MSDGEDDPLDPELRKDIARHYLAYERTETVVQPVQRQNRGKTGDKNSGRKPSANHSTKEDVKMSNMGTSVTGRDMSSGTENGMPFSPSRSSVEELAAYYARVEAKINEVDAKISDIANPLSLTNGAKYAIGAIAGVGLGFAITGIVSLFKGSEVVSVTPPVMGK